MTIKKLSLLFVCSTAIFSGLSCTNNPIFDLLQKKFPAETKPETLFGTTAISTGLLWATITGTAKEYKLRRRLLLKSPGLVLAIFGAECTFNSLNKVYNWVK